MLVKLGWQLSKGVENLQVKTLTYKYPKACGNAKYTLGTRTCSSNQYACAPILKRQPWMVTGEMKEK